jgi:putative ABC transport system permease protein
MNDFLRDLKHSMRMLRRSPGFTFTAVAALALGIAAVTAIFSIVNAVLLRPFPIRDPDRFVILMNNSVDAKGQAGSNPAVSPVKFAFLRAQTGILEDVSASESITFNYTGGDKPERLSALQASAATFRVWGIPMVRGRSFTQAEDSPHGPRVAILSEGFWRTRFAADPQVLGRNMDLNGDSYTIIGVSADNLAWLQFGPLPQLIVPMQLDPNSTDVANYFGGYARLKPGITLQQAQAALAVSTQALREKFPISMAPKDTLTVKTYKEFLIGNTRPLLWVMLGAVGLVLLIACANVANLLLVRATGRRREIAIRAAIGAGRGRVVRQLLTESLLLSLAGGALGVALGYAGIRALLAINTAGLPRLGENGVALSIDWRLLTFALGISLATGIVFGLFPTLQGSRADLNTVLKDSSGRSGTGLKQNKARAALVVSEVGLSVVLLVGAALLIRTFVALYAVDPGFDPNNVLTMQMLLTGQKYQQTAGVADVMRDAVERMRAIPGVSNAAATDFLPLQVGASLPFSVIGRPATEGPFHGQSAWCPVGPGFFETFKVALKRGRIFDDRDDPKSPAVVVINEAMARQFWKDGDPLRDRIAIARGIMKEMKDEPARQIVGVVADVHNGALNVDAAPTMYVPIQQMPDALNAFLVRLMSISWAVRTQGEPYRLSAAVQEQLRQATGLPVTKVRTMAEVVEASSARQRFNMLLMTVFGGMALLLAAVGIYGLMAYTVEQRTREIGIRLALGAEASQVRNMVMRQGMALALAGVAIGIGAAWALARLIESLLFGVKARDPLVFMAVPLALAVVALLAVWLPAIRASRVNPIDSLRYE